MAAPKGNTNATRARQWRDALDYALNNYIGCKKGMALREIAKTLISKAIEGDMTAIREIGDRLDGKAHQTLEATIRNPSTADEMTDAELANIAAASSNRTTKEKTGKNPLH